MRAVNGGVPVRLFLDVDGGLCALPRAMAAMWLGLERVALPAAEPYPSHVWADPAVVAALNELIDTGLVKPTWCTSWDDGANALIPALGLHGGLWPVATLGTRRGALMWKDIWIKAEAVSRLVGDERFVMVDDLLGNPGDRPMAVQRRSMITAFGEANTLLIGTRPERGLTLDEVARITDFVTQP